MLSKGLAFVVLLASVHAFAETVSIDGSSTVFPITEAVAEEFQAVNKDVHVTVGISGTGGGFKKFCRGETDVQDASRPIQEAEIKACQAAGIRYLELPIAYDAIALVVNPQNKAVNEITIEELKKMWEPEAKGKITKWNQVNKAWPAEEFKLYGAGSDSGTFDYFTEAVVGKAKSSRGDYNASEDDNTLVMGIAREKNAFGYIPLHYYVENQKNLKALAVNYKGKSQKPDIEAVKSGKYTPFSRPLFIYVSEKSLAKKHVEKFVDYYLKNAVQMAEEVKYIALPKVAMDMTQEHFQSKKWGTVFKGHSEVGMKVEDLLKKEKQ